MADASTGTSGNVSSSIFQDLAANADRIRHALDVGRSGIWAWDAATRRFIGDHGLALLCGLPDATDVEFEKLLGLVHPDDVQRVEAELGRAASRETPQPSVIEFRIRRPNDGSERWISMQGRRFDTQSGPGSTVELVGMARDVTSRKQRETHLHLLMREVTHRSKNLLAIIQAMARQTVKDSLSAREFEERFSARLRGLSASHDLLAARDWHGAAVADLVRRQLGPTLEATEGQVVTKGPPLFLKPEAAQNIGLAINELASNASRFGALSGPGGRVDIEWSIDPYQAQPRWFHITWRETGGPEVATPRRYGFGHKVVERLAARALDGNVSLSFAAAGLEWSLHIPASFVIEDETGLSLN